MYTLLLYERLAIDPTAFWQNITTIARGWRRSTRAVGGFWMGDFTVAAEDLNPPEMIVFYNTCLGKRIVEKTGSITTWEGEIVEMVLTLGGVQYRRTLHPNLWHNKVKARYGAGAETAWSEKTESSDFYGESGFIDVLSIDHDATSAAATRDRRLTKYAYPRSRVAGGLVSGGEQGLSERSLSVVCTGYVFSMNRRFYESDSASAAISSQITTLVGASEFVTAGQIEVNSTAMPITCAGMGAPLWDLARALIEAGDSSGNDWVGGCYEGREFDYEQAETAVTHYWKNNRLYDISNSPLEPSMVKPNIIVQISGLLSTITPPGGSLVDNPRNVYIEEIEFVAPDILRLIPEIE